MSRSYKKISIFKDSHNHEIKKKASRKVRRASKEAIHHERDIVPNTKELTNQYNICDHKWFPSKKDIRDYNRGKRK